MTERRGERARAELERRQQAKRERTIQRAEDVELLKMYEPPEPPAKKVKKTGAQDKRMIRSYIPWEEATKKHPYVDRLHYRAVITSSHNIRDRNGKLLAVFVKNVVPDVVREQAAEVLRRVPRSSDLRSYTNGGQPPLSGIGGYYDYAGTPQLYKCRKTSFTHDHFQEWGKCFPLVEYANEFYKKALPEKWKLQDAAIPDPVRIRRSVFSTVTVNKAFRTATHTDCGDFDHGFGLITILEGNYKGVMLGLPEARVCVDLRPGDFLLFDTHCTHGNTEVEPIDGDWGRISCVMYYRFRLGEPACMDIYKERKKNNDANKAQKVGTVDDSHESFNERNVYPPAEMDVMTMLLGWGDAHIHILPTVKGLCEHKEEVHSILDFHVYDEDQLDKREEDEYSQAREYFDINAIKLKSRASSHKYSGGFSLQLIESLESDIKKKKEDGLCDATVLRRVFGEGLTNEWLDVKQKWLAEVEKAWKVSRKTKSKTDARLTWNNTGTLQEAFTALCDVSVAMFEAKNGVEDMSECPSSDRESWWLGFAVHLIRVLLYDYKIPITYVTLQKLNIKLKDYEFGGTRYMKDYSEEHHKARMERIARLKEMRDSGEGVYNKPKISTWASNDMFDYQTEDQKVDYDELELESPKEAFKHLKAVPDEDWRKAKVRLASILVWRQDIPVLSTTQATRLRNQFKPSEDIPTIPKVGITVSKPSAVPDGETFDVICIVGILSATSRSRVKPELKRAVELLNPGGLLIIKEYSPQPFDYSRLVPEALMIREEFVANGRDILNDAAKVTVETTMYHPDTLIEMVAACGLTNSCGVYQVQGSCLNEYYLAFCNDDE
eukprot:TRINITY_DN9088_c0_g1_i1.p1 TRINITY_DN9088_c0_g1~~TRINITY_DN9088_c0_g1_i1.p1  ORF type:complete len:833 (+),score=330.62 TRINITY_DN9088_c0_g1_i1:36-2534(+)